MTANVCPLRALPGRSQNGTHYRHCRSEKETLAHILGACPHGELLRDSRHHKIRSLLASALRGKNYQVEEEVHAREGPRPTSRLLASRPHAEAEVDDHSIRMETDTRFRLVKDLESCQTRITLRQVAVDFPLKAAARVGVVF
ncbi:hypothetical protein ANN_00406 [Periplaneta americana]|uniref:Uncharacterized protein n=1 Tax=Periplaneta americana TaxID=6978 RepID=A0ABQ8TTI3_PERAM|nr:hypothetical protein ANN_00406 [Periplaneta americana]